MGQARCQLSVGAGGLSENNEDANFTVMNSVACATTIGSGAISTANVIEP